MLTRKHLPGWNVLTVAALAVVVLWGAGCTANRVTNLTPRQVNRSSDGLITVEARWDTRQRAVREDSVTPWVVVGTEFHPMQRTALTSNRWEALVPVPTNQAFLNYHFKFDYRVQGFGKQHPNSRLSSGYQVEILDARE
jgi:hypothetical protein